MIHLPSQAAQSDAVEMVPEKFYSKVNLQVSIINYYLIMMINIQFYILIPYSYTTLFQVKGSDYAVLDSYCRYVITAGKALDIDIGGR